MRIRDFFSGLHELRRFAIAFFEISYHKNCSNDENNLFRKKQLRNRVNPKKIPNSHEFLSILLNSHHKFVRNRAFSGTTVNKNHQIILNGLGNE
jgi:hypothetical protein